MTDDNNKGVVIRKFSKDGCMPCRALTHAMAREAERIADTGAIVIEHDIGVETELIEKHRLQSVPVLVFERNGLEMARLEGLCNIEEVIDAIEYTKAGR